MALSDEFIQELKARSDIADVISSYINLKRSGRNLVGLCPFHNEKTPSFSVSRENGFFHCFGCGIGGDVITFIKRIENLDYIDAVKMLAQRAGLNMPEDNNDQGLSRLKNRIYEANREAAKFYHKNLYTPDGFKALEYLRKRQLSEKTIIHFGLGYSPPSRFELVNHLKSKGFSSTELIAANLANESKKGNPFDRFSDRVMFPIIDLRGNVIGFGGRIMSDIKPKYLNTSDTLVFNKSKNLFALQFAKNKANGQLILVEGYMDVIALHQAGFENAVATLGTALTQEQAAVIKRYCDEVVICYDADEAGQKATSRAISILRTTGLNIKILTVPNGKDPDEYIRAHGEQGSARFKILLDKCGNDVEYRLHKLKMNYNIDITEQRVAFLTEASKLLATLDNKIEQEVYISSLSKELNIEKSSMRQQVAKYYKNNAVKSNKREQREIQNIMSARNDRINSEKFYNLRAANAEEALISLMIFNPDIANTICSKVSSDKFITSFNRKVFEVLRNRVLNGKDITITDISAEFSSDEISGITKMLAFHQRESNPVQAAEEYLRVLDEEAQKLTPEQIAKADVNTLMERLRKMKEKKK